jgi:hypothetical protein
MLAVAGEVVNPAQVVPTRRSKPKAVAEAAKQTAQVALMKKKLKKGFKKKLGKAAEATKQTAQVALMKKRPKTPRKRPEKVVEADPTCAVRTAQLNEQRLMVQRPSAFVMDREKCV